MLTFLYLSFEGFFPMMYKHQIQTIIIFSLILIGYGHRVLQNWVPNELSPCFLVTCQYWSLCKEPSNPLDAICFFCFRSVTFLSNGSGNIVGSRNMAIPFQVPLLDGVVMRSSNRSVSSLIISYTVSFVDVSADSVASHF